MVLVTNVGYQPYWNCRPTQAPADLQAMLPGYQHMFTLKLRHDQRLQQTVLLDAVAQVAQLLFVQLPHPVANLNLL